MLLDDAPLPEIITITWIEAMVQGITAKASDPEEFHRLRDYLWMTILHSIGTGKIVNADLCAQVALRLANVDTSIWYA